MTSSGSVFFGGIRFGVFVSLILGLFLFLESRGLSFYIVSAILFPPLLFADVGKTCFSWHIMYTFYRINRYMNMYSGVHMYARVYVFARV